MASTCDRRAGPLTDLRVIEMGQFLAGPFCGQLLADFGAEVIKLEPPGEGDPMREWSRERSPELGQDPRYATHVARGEAQAELDALIAGWTRTLEAAQLEEVLNKHGVPAGRMFRAPEMLADAQYKARESIVRVMHPALGGIAMQNDAPKLSDSPGKVLRPGPELGQHNAEVYRDILGLADGEMKRLAEKGII